MRGHEAARRRPNIPGASPMRYRRLNIPGATVFLTMVLEDRRPLFQNAATVALLNAAIEKVRARHPFECEAHAVLPDHLHVLWTLPEGDTDYPKRVRLFKEAFTRAYMYRHAPPERSESRRAKGEQAIWQRRYWEHTVRDERDIFAHLDYVHLNPVHHGLAQSPGAWPHSSFAAWVAREVYEPHWGSDTMPELPAWAKGWE